MFNPFDIDGDDELDFSEEMMATAITLDLLADENDDDSEMYDDFTPDNDDDYDESGDDMDSELSDEYDDDE